MNEAKEARVKVRERERAIWNHVEAVGREARAADGATVKAAATASTDAKQEKQAQTLSSGS